MRRSTYLATTPFLFLLQALLVNGSLLLVARFYSAIPARVLAGFLLLVAVPLVGAGLVIFIGMWLIRQLGDAAHELEHRLMMAAAIAGATLWLFAAAGMAVGLHDYGMLLAHGARDGLRPAELVNHREAGFATLADAEVRWPESGAYHYTTRPKDSTTTYHNYELAYPIRDAQRPDQPTGAWLCVNASSPDSLPEFEAGYREHVEAAGVVAGLLVHDPSDNIDCGRAVADAASKGVATLDAPVFLRFRASADEARATLGRRVGILLAIANGLLVLLPLLLDIRRGATDRSLK